jgi:ribosome-binding ATPase YchF (GTP1/OBG family)
MRPPLTAAVGCFVRRFGDWNLKEVDFLNRVQLISAKPVVYLVNLTEKAYIKKKAKWLPKVGLAPCAAAACVPTPCLVCCELLEVLHAWISML